MISVEILNQSNEAQWIEFVEKHVQYNYAFSLEWKKVLDKVFGYSSFYFLVKEEQNVVGVLPLFLVKSLILKDRFISIPFSDMGGFCFKENVADNKKLEAFYQIEEYLKHKFSRYWKVPVELRNPDFYSNRPLLEHRLFSHMEPYVKFVLDLDNSWEEIENKVSRNIKRNLESSKEKIKIGFCEDKRELVKVYKLYLKEMKKFGSPPLPLAFFENLWDELYLKGDFVVLSAYYKDSIIGALTLLGFKDTLYADLIMGDKKYKWLFPKQQLYRASIRYAWQIKRFKRYDFSRTRKDSGVHEHKRKWGGKEEVVVYYYRQRQRRKENQQIVFLDPEQKRLLSWKKFFKIMPIFLLKLLGKSLRKQVGK